MLALRSLVEIRRRLLSRLHCRPGLTSATLSCLASDERAPWLKSRWRSVIPEERAIAKETDGAKK